MDTLSPSERSDLMRRIRGRDTGPERMVRSCVHRLGYRFRLHDGRLPGTPDIVLPRLRMVILVHGCFWHRHAGCRYAYTPKSRRAFWEKKFADNVARDERDLHALKQAGWRVAVVWECETRDKSRLRQRLRRLLKAADRDTH